MPFDLSNSEVLLPEGQGIAISVSAAGFCRLPAGSPYQIVGLTASAAPGLRSAGICWSFVTSASRDLFDHSLTCPMGRFRQRVSTVDLAKPGSEAACMSRSRWNALVAICIDAAEAGTLR